MDWGLVHLDVSLDRPPDAAAAAGYLVYTGSHRNPTAEPACPGDGTTAVEPITGGTSKGREPSRIGRNLLLAAWDLLMPVAARAGRSTCCTGSQAYTQCRRWAQSVSHPSLRAAERPDGPGESRGQAWQRLPRSKQTFWRTER